ncbi:MAG TPA: folylpolyglutamate synthase/dihydrofolate synthase family protein [Thermoanaerobaculia bacterium]|nr:folylpolyglutamate synthase/dihydrofolate synthase family protein [Thermoanaerobaculia bacterium]
MPLPSTAERLLSSLELFGIRLGLETTRALLGSLGSPERHQPAVLVAGTNGKGSTAAMLASIAAHAGYSTGLYTSPHLEDVEERIRFDGAAIDGTWLGELLEEVVAAARRELGASLTYFEALTVAAFLSFRRRPVDLVVLEVGMGGRLDATNAAEPLISVITSISLDHTAHLGETLSAIAREKAGILRPGRPAVLAPAGEEARSALAEAVSEVGSRPHWIEEECRLERATTGGPNTVTLVTPSHRYRLDLGLAGHHQRANAAAAVRAAELLAEGGWERIDRRAIEAGIARCRWPGRLETVPLSGGAEVLLDAAHNPSGAKRLAEHLAHTGRPFDLLFGCFVDKDAAAMLPCVAAGARRVILTQTPGTRGADPAQLAGLLPAGNVTVEPDLERALDLALAAAPERLVITGSIYLVGELRRALRARIGRPALATDPLWPSTPANEGGSP